ncbi:MAG TPA: uroporphyrinogen decarboxylase family protein [Thermodesulfovibrionia bacterium]|nr:uroporphyrinogen decarboxylase family protein [Thermodesulfovibrionia bacterium]
MRERIKEVLNRASFARGHIFNLGHGVLPETPVENVVAMVEMVHRLSRK